MLRSALLVILLVLVATILCATPARAGNDDSCDIGLAPAATLLLPYFEVDVISPAGVAQTTVFTITNVSPRPQIAHVTLWTDWAYAALGFNILLPPYGIQSIDLRELFVRGTLSPGARPFDRDALTDALRRNPNLNETAGAPGNILTACADMPASLPPLALADLRRIFTTGAPGMTIGTACSGSVGGTHSNAIGYVTVDVVATCTTDFPGPAYFASDILFDNVLVGDYILLDRDPSHGNWATGNPMVHLRAIPEGGPAGSTPGTNLPFTFYDRFTATSPQTLPRAMDRRQPLPALFAAHWIQRGGTVAYATNFDIWREGLTGPSSTSCDVAANHARNGPPYLARFDEHENTNSTTGCLVVAPACPAPDRFAATSSTSLTSSAFPGLTTSGDLEGWMYLNLNNGGSAAYSSSTRPSQNWVVIDMYVEGQRAFRFDAAALGNGCSPAVDRDTVIGPAGGAPVCPPGAVGCTPGVAPYTGNNGPPS